MGSIRPHLGFFNSVCTALPESNERQPFHFFRIFSKYFTASHAYVNWKKTFSFTTHLHGEERAFIDPRYYDRVMPMNVPVEALVKAVIVGDFERAQQLGLLEVAPEDFALPTFVCPSKIEMVEIMENGLHRFALETLI